MTKALHLFTFIFMMIGIIATVDFIADILAPMLVQEDNSIHFVWNDDEESIPKDGSLIMIEFTDENTIYIGPVEDKTDILMKSFMDKQHQKD